MLFSTGIIIAIAAFLAEYVDSALGMGYGTILTPALLLFGFSPLQVVPSVLLSELVTGLLAGFTHHRAGNVDFKPKSFNIFFIIKKIREFGFTESFERGIPIHLKIALVLGSCCIIGTISAVFLAVSLSKFLLVLIVGIIIFLIGLFILGTLNKNYSFSWRKIIFLGLVASFNKGLSAGGYGPIVTGGQLLAGVDSKNAVGITSLAEGLTCLVGIIVYWLKVPHLDLRIAPFNITGALLAVPLAVFSVKISSTRRMKLIIGILTVVLGILTIAKIAQP